MKILAIDDSKSALTQIEFFVKNTIPNADVLKVRNPSEGLEIGLNLGDELALLIIDYNMEGMNGIELIDALLPKISPSKMVLCTGNNQPSLKAEAEKRGIFFVNKAELQLQLKSILTSILQT
jgi:DNA-binding LytR/AlgR family response regulator